MHILKLIIFLLTIYSFGFAVLFYINKIKSMIFLLPFSFSFGVSAYIFICHIFSFLIGPKLSSVVSIFTLFMVTIIIIFIHAKELPEVEINKNTTWTVVTAIIICILTYLAISRFGPYDKEFHIPLAATLFHNNVYPPRDFYRPFYVLLYHYGGDLFAGAINFLCNIELSRCFEIISSLFSGITFLSYFSLAWLLTKNFKLSFLGGFCSYFGGGLLWLDALVRYCLDWLPDGYKNWGLVETFFNIGIHGGIIDAPAITTFVSTFAIGNPVLIFSLVLFWQMLQEKNLKIKTAHIISLNIALFTLSLTAEWLYTTFLGSLIVFLFFLFLKKQTQEILFPILTIIFSFLLNKSVGNALFLQDQLQGLGRANIFDIGIKEKLFEIMSWGRLTPALMDYEKVSCFSWDFVSAFGFSLFLLPVAIIYLIKTKNKFGLLLFLLAAITMPVPLIINFKLNPVDLNRLFCFGNTILILLITCGIGTLFQHFFKNRILILIYVFVFCLSPLSGLISAAMFTPSIYSNKEFAHTTLRGISKIKTISNIPLFFKSLNRFVLRYRNSPYQDFIKEIKFLKEHSKPGDVAISSLVELPAYSGVYSLIPGGKWLYKDLIYSSYDSIFLTALTTLAPHLLYELNIKWILINNNSKESLPEETKRFLDDSSLFNLAYTNIVKGQKYEIYHVNNPHEILSNSTRKTAWLLVNKHGQPIEIVSLPTKKITLFPSINNALAYLKLIQDTYPKLKKELITAQAISIKSLEWQIRAQNLNVLLEKKF